MEEITSHILRPGTFTVAVAVVVLTFFIRRVVETIKPDLKNKEPYKTQLAKWWNSVILYAIPVVLGACTAFISSDFIHGDIKDLGGRLLFQGGVGWFASFMYKVLRKIILKKTGVDIRPGDIVPEN
jgi:Na+/H+ antiporter NhaD/arsenite permease-like protein